MDNAGIRYNYIEYPIMNNWDSCSLNILLKQRYIPRNMMCLFQEIGSEIHHQPHQQSPQPPKSNPPADPPSPPPAELSNTEGRALTQMGNKQVGASLKYATLKYITFK